MKALQIIIFSSFLIQNVNALLKSSYLLEEGINTRKIPIEIDDVGAFGREILSILGIEEPEESPIPQRSRRDRGSLLYTEGTEGTEGTDPGVSSPNETPQPAEPIDEPRHFNSEAADFMKSLYGQIDDERMLAENHLEMLKNATTIMSFGATKIFSIGDFTAVAFDSMNFPQNAPDYAEIRLHFSPSFDGEVWLYTKRNGELIEYFSISISQENPRISINITKEFQSWIDENQTAELFVQMLNAERVIFAQDFSIFGIVSYEGNSPKSVPQRKKRSASKGSTSSGTNVGYMSVNFDPLRGETDVNDIGCHRKGLYVNFNDLGWKDWVIAPEGFQAFLCDGTCSFPLHSKMNATNHAIVQTLVHLLHPQRAPSPRCAPSRLSQQKIIFIDNSENVVLKRYQDMIVQECGCQ